MCCSQNRFHFDLIPSNHEECSRNLFQQEELMNTDIDSNQAYTQETDLHLCLIPDAESGNVRFLKMNFTICSVKEKINVFYSLSSIAAITLSVHGTYVTVFIFLQNRAKHMSVLWSRK